MRPTQPTHLTWRTSSYSSTGNGNCVEIATTEAATHIRDSKNPTGPTLRIPSASWHHFLR